MAKTKKDSKSKQSSKATSAAINSTPTNEDDSVVIPNTLTDKPSTMFHGDLYTVRLYTDESIDGHVYTHVKHLWYKNNGQTLCICHFYPNNTYRFVMWHARQVVWYQMCPERFEANRA